MILLQFALLLFSSIHYVSCDTNIYKSAVLAWEKRNCRAVDLHAKHHMIPGEFLFNVWESYWNGTLENQKAEILEEFAKIVGKRHPKRKDFLLFLKILKLLVQKKNRYPKSVHCHKHPKYYSIGGECNNLKYTLFGASSIPYKHILESPFFEGKVRTTKCGKELPKIRDLGNDLEKIMYDCSCDCCSLPCPCADICTGYFNNYLSVIFFEFINHDVSLRNFYQYPENENLPINCCKTNGTGFLPDEEVNPRCIALSVPEDDPVYSKAGIVCLNYILSRPTLHPDGKIQHTLHENLRDSFFDLSQIYSNNIDVLSKLRDDFGGLVLSAGGIAMQNPCDLSKYITGDPRATDHCLSTVMHAIFNRAHNKIRNELAARNPKWDSDKLFYECRRIMTAIYQSIIYNEWCSKFLGEDVCIKNKLTCGFGSYPKCDKYDEHIDPTISDEFAFAASQMYHRHIPDTFDYYDKEYKPIETKKFGELFSNCLYLEDCEKFKSVLYGLLGMKMRSTQRGYSDGARSHAYEYGWPVGLDLFLFDVMVGREIGLPPYAEYIKYFKLGNIHTMEDMKQFVDDAHYNILNKYYSDVYDIDLLVGLVFENLGNSQFGPVGAAIFGEQLYRSKYGDRFFFNNRKSPSNQFSKKQIADISNMNFGKLLCWVTDIEKVPAQAFVIPIKGVNDLIDCSKYSISIDFDDYKDC